MGEPVRVARERELREVIELSEGSVLGRVMPYPKEVEIRGRISRDLIEEISRSKGEPEWMRLLRLKALETFEKLPAPNWLEGVESVDLDEIAAYVRPKVETAESWDQLPDWLRDAYAKLGLPEAEAKVLSGLTAVFDSPPARPRGSAGRQRGSLTQPMLSSGGAAGPPGGTHVTP